MKTLFAGRSRGLTVKTDCIIVDRLRCRGNRATAKFNKRERRRFGSGFDPHGVLEEWRSSGTSGSFSDFKLLVIYVAAGVLLDFWEMRSVAIVEFFHLPAIGSSI